MAEAKQKLGFFGRIKKYFKDFKSEVKKITWSSKEEVLKNTVIVLAAILLVGVVIWVLDFLFGGAITFVLTQGLK